MNKHPFDPTTPAAVFAEPGLKAGLQKRTLRSEVAGDCPTEHGSKCMLGIAALVMMALGILSRNPVVGGLGALLVGVLVALRLATDWRSGVTSSNWGTWRRDQNRLAFGCNIGFWAAVSLACFVLGALVMLGVFQAAES